MLWCAWSLGCLWCWFLAWTFLRWGPWIAFCMRWKCWCCQGQKWAWPKLHLLHNGTWQKNKCCHPVRWTGMNLLNHCTPPRCFYPQTPQNRRHLQWINCHPSQLGWDPVMRHTHAPDMVGAAERVAKHVTCGKRTGTTGMGAMPTLGVLGVVLCFPWRGLFMCPLAVARLGLRYLCINFSLIFGQPVRKPHCVAFSRVDFFWIAQWMVCKLNCICSCLHWMCEHHNLGLSRCRGIYMWFAHFFLHVNHVPWGIEG